MKCAPYTVQTVTTLDKKKSHLVKITIKLNLQQLILKQISALTIRKTTS